MSASHTGTKRPHPNPDSSGDRDRRDRPRDWRDAFFDERERSDSGYRRDDRDRDLNRERDRDRDHVGDRRDHGRDREHDRHYQHGRDDRRGDRHRERDYGRDRDDRRGNNGGLDYRDRERPVGFPSSRDRRDEPSRADGREEGEIDSPPRRSEHLSPRESRPPPSPRRDDRDRRGDSRDRNREMPPPRRDDRRNDASPRRGFQPITVPLGPTGDGKAAPPAGFETGKKHETEPEPIPEPEPELDEDDLEKKREEKRRRREAIMAKFRTGEGAKPPLPTGLSPGGTEPGSGADSMNGSTGFPTGVNSETGATPLLKMLGTRSITAALTPAGNSPTLASTPLGNDYDLEKHGEEEASTAKADISAADYDSTIDTEKLKAKPDVAPPAKGDEEGDWEEVEIEVEEEDEDVDMFAAFGDDEPVKKTRKVTVRRRKNANGEVITEKPKSHKQSVLEIVDNVDDVEGYYRITPGELLDDGRYQVTVTLGKGMFSAVVRATVLKAVGQERRQDVVGKEVAIKLMRSQESMYVAGRKEAQVLKLLNDADPDDKKHIVRMERTFEHKGHLAIVTESMSMNLRDVIKRFGKDVGLNMRAVRAYAHQMLLALSLMRKCNIVHADIKPDNVLVSENKAVLKVCDLGTAAEVSEGEVTPYLVSRFYRAPEIILGLAYDTAIDMWAIGCTLFELYTGKILFPGRSNNNMLLCMMEVKGKLPHRMIKKASLGHMHFDENNNFISEEKDRITGAAITKTIVITKATRDLRSRLMPHSSVQAKMKEDELKQLQQFVDLLEKCLMLDPVRRISPREALLHPFVSGSS